jgi:hypothetical protein
MLVVVSASAGSSVGTSAGSNVLTPSTAIQLVQFGSRLRYAEHCLRVVHALLLLSSYANNTSLALYSMPALVCSVLQQATACD